MRPELAVLYAMYHDMPETILGDTPHPAKAELGNAICEAEAAVLPRLFPDIEKWLAEILRAIVAQRMTVSDEFETSLESEIVNWADKMSALAFAHQEVMQGNNLFRPIRKDTARLVLSLLVTEWGDVLHGLIPDLRDTLEDFAGEEMIVTGRDAVE